MTGKFKLSDLEQSDVARILLFGLHLQATEAGNGDGFCTRTVIPSEIWDIMYDGELLFNINTNPEGDIIVTTQAILDEEAYENERHTHN